MIREEWGKGSIGGLIGELGKAVKNHIQQSECCAGCKARPLKAVQMSAALSVRETATSNAETVIRNCYATGNVTGGAYTGGFAGGIWGLNIIELLRDRKCIGSR